MSLKCLAVDSNIDNASHYTTEWAERGVSMDRVDTMTEAIEKLMSNDYIFVGINGDATDFMPLLRTMRSVTNTPILIVTGNFTTEKEIAAMENGADLYARWHESPKGNVSSVLAHITRVAERSKMSRPATEVKVYRDLLIAPAYRQVFVRDTEIGLTKTEFDVLHFFMNHRGHALSTEQIYSHVWGNERAESVNDAVKNTIKRLRSKISGQDTDSNLIENVWGVGYRFPTTFEK